MDIITTTYQELGSHISTEKSTACSDYVLCRRLQKKCKAFLENIEETCKLFDFKLISIYKVKKEPLINKCFYVLERSASIDLVYLQSKSEEMEDGEFVKYVLAFSSKVRKKSKK